MRIQNVCTWATTFALLGSLTTAPAFAGNDEPFRSPFLDGTAITLADTSSVEQTPQEDTQPRSQTTSGVLSMGFLHKCLGYGSLLGAGITAGTSSSESVHEGAGFSTAGLALATCITGFIAYSDYFDLSEGLSAYNLHIILGTAGAVGFGAASALGSGNDGGGAHVGLGSASTAMMVLPVILVRW